MSPFILVLLSATVPSAATLTVDPSGAGDFAEIQAAIDAAQQGDLVFILPGEYIIREPITYRGKAITVRGRDGARATTIRMSPEPADPARASVVIFENGETEGAILEGVTIRGGKGTWDPRSRERLGGGILCSMGTLPILRSCVIS